MIWRLSNRADPRARALADRHYSRQKPGATQFCPAGSAFVLYAEAARGAAYWVTSNPIAEWVKHEWAGAWMCSAFRNEGAGLSSELILDAISATRWRYGEPPPLGMVTFVDESKVNSRNPGYCFKMAGFRVCGRTMGGLLALQLLPAAMPPSAKPLAWAPDLFEIGAAHVMA